MVNKISEIEYYIGNRVLLTFDNIYPLIHYVDTPCIIISKHDWSPPGNFSYDLKTIKDGVILQFMLVDTFVIDTTRLKKLERILC